LAQSIAAWGNGSLRK